MLQTQIILIAVLLVFSAFFSASESALLSLSRFKVRYMVEKKRIGAVYVKRLKDDPERLLSTILIGNNIVNVGASALGTSIAIAVFKNNAIGIATGIMTFLVLVFGEITPKSLATRNNERFSLVAAPVVWWLSIAINPIIIILNYFLKYMNKLIGTKRISIVTKEELKSILKTSEEEGSIKEIEKRLIHRIFDFENTTVGDVMTPKKSMACVNADMPIKDVLQLPTAKMYSRLPVYGKNKDDIIGVLYLKDMLKFVKDGKLDAKAKDIMKKPLFVFEHKKMDTMLRLFQNRKQHMAIVIDSKAHVVGLVTIENILEEIVGEIIDESDKINPSITQISKNEWAAKGSTEIEEINARAGISIKKSDFVDLDSFILAALGRAPKHGEEIVCQGFKLVMDDVQGKKVLRVRIVRI